MRDTRFLYSIQAECSPVVSSESSSKKIILPERSYTSIEVNPGSESSNEMNAEELKGFGVE